MAMIGQKTVVKVITISDGSKVGLSANGQRADCHKFLNSANCSACCGNKACEGCAGYKQPRSNVLAGIGTRRRKQQEQSLPAVAEAS